MSGVQHFIPKQNQELPDSYGIKVHYFDGTTEELDVASHQIIDKVNFFGPSGVVRLEANPSPSLEILTKDDLFHLIPMGSFRKLSFDKRYSKIVALRKKDLEEKAKQQPEKSQVV